MLKSKNSANWKGFKTKSTRMKPGKKTRNWESVRAKIKKQFEAVGITRCEVCGTDQFLSFAHRLKRRKITTPEELEMVALICIPDHEVIECLPADEMYARITEIIDSREIAVE